MIRKFLRQLPFVKNAAIIALSLVVGALALTSPANAQRDDAAESFVNKLASEAIEILGRESLSPTDREAAFRVLFVGNMDVPRIGAFALGQYVRTPTPEQKTEYLRLVENFIVKVYATRLSDYTNQVFNILSSQPKGNRGTEVIVTSQIEFATGRAPVPVEWWLLRDGGSFKVFDVKVVGIWMAQEQRSSFISVIRNHNGDFDSLLTHIAERIGEQADEINSKLTDAETSGE
ncbi:MAG: ABC transporter substrate-binding protein [Rhodobiaceae bacterium]|nr:ABC transporter substrate-binding protein [Rhodobiaceae bacterium]